MRPQPNTPWSRAGEQAAQRWGLATRADLIAAGCTPRSIRTATTKGRIFRIHRGVYSLGAPIASPHARALAAVLAAGPDALLCNRWALWLWGLTRLPDEQPHVSAPTTRTGARPGFVVHRTRSLAYDLQHGIPVTTPARTLSDCAPLLTTRQLRRAVNDAQIRNLVDQRELLSQPSLRALVADHAATRSVLEDILVQALGGTTSLQVNAIVHGIEVDFYLPDKRLVIEADGWAFHHTKIAFENDHERRLHLEAAGERVIAVTHAQARQRATIDRLRTIIADT